MPLDPNYLAAIKARLRSILFVGGGIHSEYDLLRELSSLLPVNDEQGSAELQLFQKHYLLMHALYQLQDECRSEGLGYLRIGALEIGLLPPEPGQANNSLSSEADAEIALRAYYLDFSNFERATASRIRCLLDDFWRRYAKHSSSSQQQALQALAEFGLSWPCTETELRSAYRRRAQALHPDRGGSANEFSACRESYESALDFIRRPNS